MSLYETFRRAAADYARDPSFRNEGRVIQAYAEWAHDSAPREASDLIQRMIRDLAALSRSAA